MMTTPHHTSLTHYHFTYYDPNNKKTKRKTDAAYSSLYYSYSVEMETQIEINSYSFNGRKERSPWREYSGLSLVVRSRYDRIGM